MYLGSSQPHATWAVVCGLVLGYIGYDLTHYYLHHGTPSTPYFTRLKAVHMVHHFHDHAVGEFASR